MVRGCALKVTRAFRCGQSDQERWASVGSQYLLLHPLEGPSRLPCSRGRACSYVHLHEAWSVRHFIAVLTACARFCKWECKRKCRLSEITLSQSVRRESSAVRYFGSKTRSGLSHGRLCVLVNAWSAVSPTSIFLHFFFFVFFLF